MGVCVWMLSYYIVGEVWFIVGVVYVCMLPYYIMGECKPSWV